MPRRVLLILEFMEYLACDIGISCRVLEVFQWPRFRHKGRGSSNESRLNAVAIV